MSEIAKRFLSTFKNQKIFDGWFLTKAVEEEITEKFRHVIHTKKYDVNNVKAARMYVQKFLGLTLYSPHLYQNIKSGGEHGKTGHEHKHEE